jgi:hypothetical protein
MGVAPPLLPVEGEPVALGHSPGHRPRAGDPGTAVHAQGVDLLGEGLDEAPEGPCPGFP